MTTTGIPLATLPTASGRAGFGGTLRSELTKIRSVRSTYWTLLVLVVISIGLGAVFTGAAAANWSHTSAADRATFDPTQVSVAALFYLGQIVIVVLGALTLTAEYSTGMIRTSLTAMPRRTTVYAAKAVVLACITAVVSFAAAFISFFLGQALLASTHDTATLSQPGVLRAVIGAAVYVTTCGLFTYAVGSILRSTPAAIATVIGLLFIIPILAALLPENWRHDVVRWLPSSAGQALSTTVGQPDAHLFSPWAQFAVFAAYTAALLVAGAVLFRTRDA